MMIIGDICVKIDEIQLKLFFLLIGVALPKY